MLPGMGEQTTAMTELADVTGLRAERASLVGRLEAASQEAAVLETRYDRATRDLASEKADVDALERMSMTRIIAGIKGTRGVDLDREQAEARAAEYAAAEALQRLQEAQATAHSLRMRVNALGDLDARWERALAAREEELAASGDDPTARRVGELAAGIAEGEAQAREVDEALSAAHAAVGALQAARAKISSAGNWATYDTFFDGGIFADMAKYNRLDEAAALMRHADAALRHLATELADVGMAGTGEIGISDMTRTFDVWFDNIFTDWAVRDRINQAGGRIDHVGTQIDRLVPTLVARRDEIAARVAGMRGERESLLVG